MFTLIAIGIHGKLPGSYIYIEILKMSLNFGVLFIHDWVNTLNIELRLFIALIAFKIEIINLYI